MVKIDAKISDVETSCVKEVRCPVCGHLIMDVRFVKGALIVKTKCPRCKMYVDIDVVGNDIAG